MTRSFNRIAPGALAILLAPPFAVASPGDITLHGAGLDVLGDNLVELQVVDLNGDGLEDLLASGTNLGVWRNVGGGRLTPLPSFPPLMEGGVVQAIDLDGDGIPSLVSFGADAIHAKTFVAPFVPGPEQLVAPFGIGPSFVQAADLDGDGLTDVVTGAEPSAILSSLNDGSGGLQPGVLSAAIPATSFGLGDIDLDGRIDVVAAAESTLTAALGQGDGTFVPQPPIALTGSAKDVALGHIDGDGLLDVVVAAFGGTQVLVGAGGGGFTPFAHDAESTRLVDLADADGDGDDDVLSVSLLGGDVHISFVDPSGLSPQPGFIAGVSVRDVAFADFGGVGRPGAVVLGYGQYMEVTWVPGDGTGALDLEPTLQAAPASQMLALADVDGDGHQELVVWQRIAGQVVVQVLPGDGTLGPAGTPTPYAPPLTWPYVAASVLDLDADAFDDLLLQDDVGWHPWRSNGDGTFTIGPVVSVGGGSAFQYFATGDIDGDGHDDLLVSGTAPAWFRSQGDGTFGPPQSVSVPGLSLEFSWRLQLADAEGDGWADLFIGSSKASGDGLRWWKGAGDGTFGPPASLTAGTISTVALVVADVDGDGDVDVVAHGQGPSQPPDNPAALQAWLTVVRGHGDGTFDAPLEFRAGWLAAESFVLADLDVDGRLDAIVRLDQPHRMLLRQAADGSFADGRILPVDLDQANQSRTFVTVDLDDDGDQDFVLNTKFDVYSGTQEIHASLVERNDDVLDLGHASVGAVGKPVLSGAGRLVPGKLATLQLAAAPANAPTMLMLGLQTAYVASAGSLLVPAPQVVVPVAASAVDGTLVLTGRWPVDAPAGLAVYVQLASLDPATAAVVASNGVQLIGD